MPKPSISILEILADSLKKYRKEHSISQVDLAKLLGTTRTYISDMENAKRNIGLLKYIEIVRKLKLKLPDMLDSK